MLSKTHRALIDEEWNESQDGHWIMLKTGFHRDGAHVVHEPTKTAAYKALREVKPCTCTDCINDLTAKRSADNPIGASQMSITESQLKLMRDIDQRQATAAGCLETHCPNPSVVNALAKRGLIQARLVGQRWWRMRLTKAGYAAVRSADQLTAERSTDKQTGGK